MKHTRTRITITVLAAFISVSAIGGGIAMLTGAIRFPLVWLQNTPFSDYTIPALVLALLVGGSSLFAAVMVLAGHNAGVLASLAAGLLMAGYEIVEVVTIKQVYWLQDVYFGLGLLIVGLAAYLWKTEERSFPLHLHSRLDEP